MFALVLVLALFGFVSPVSAEEIGLADPKLRTAAFACQKVVTQTASKLATLRFKAIDRCANGALACIQSTKKPVDECLQKASDKCQTTLARAAIAGNKARTKIAAKSKCVGLRLEDVLGAEGLGFGALAQDCDFEQGVDICTGLGSLADCVVRAHERAAGELYTRARPRTAELLGLLPGESVLPISGVSEVQGCKGCNVATGEGKELTSCGELLTKETVKLQAQLDKHFTRCAEVVVGCLQAKKPKDDCLPKATARCDEKAGELAAMLGDFVAKVSTGACSAEQVPFATILDKTGLNFAGVANVCAAKGTGTPASVAQLAECLAADARCSAAELARLQVPRTTALDDAGLLGSLGQAALATCPNVSPEGTFAAEARVTFGSMSKVVRAVRGPLGRGRLAAGGQPRAAGKPRTVTLLNALRRVARGGITTIRYRVGFARSRQAQEAFAGAATLIAPPKLIIALLGAPVQDHFEVTLPFPGSLDEEMEGEIDITYQGDAPSCAFTLGFATDFLGEVSGYTSLSQVADAAVPSGHEAVLRLNNIDDRIVAFFNGTQVANEPFNGANPERKIDVTNQFKCGDNVLELQVFNDVVGYTYAATLDVDNVTEVDTRCGTFFTQACGSTLGLVVDEVHYLCIPCDGVPCTAGTCANPYVIPDRDNLQVFTPVPAAPSGQTGSCGGDGPERVFTLTPAADTCYSMEACTQSETELALYSRIGGCGAPENGDCITDGCGYFFGQIPGGQTRTIVADLFTPLTSPTELTLSVDKFVGSCD